MSKKLLFILWGISCLSLRVEAVTGDPWKAGQDYDCAKRYDTCTNLFNECTQRHSFCNKTLSFVYRDNERNAICGVFGDYPGSKTGGAKKCQDLWETGKYVNEKICADSRDEMFKAKMCSYKPAM